MTVNFSKDELVSLAPWRLPEMDGPRRREPDDAPGGEIPMAQERSPAAAESVRRQAYEEAAALGRKEGYEAGYREGYQAGLEKGFDEGREALRGRGERLTKLMEALNEPFAALDEQVERELVALAVAVAKQLVRRELKTDPGQVVAVVREALAVLPVSARKISLHLHPEDAELVRSALALEETPSAWKIVDDPLLTRGGCRVDTETSRVDATLEKRLAMVIAELLGGEREGDGAP